jgi:D-arabinose 5-phosphate isomerase GutQ
VDTKSVIFETMNGESNAIRRTLERSQDKIYLAVLQLVDCRYNYKRIFSAGAGACALMAKQLAGQALELGLKAYPLTNDLSEAQAISFCKGTEESSRDLANYFTYLFSPGDCLVCISASGKTGFVYEMAKLANHYCGVKVISITENEDSFLAKNSDIVILTYGKPEAPSATKTEACQLAVIHAMMMGYANEMNIDNKMMIKFMETQKVYSKAMGEK